MRKLLFTLFICSFALFYTACDELANLIPKGCMTATATNYDPQAILPCNDNGTANDCCLEGTPGCTNSNAFNYSDDATTPCTDCGSANCCCIDTVSGCTENAAANYNPLANTDDGTCSFASTTVTVTDTVIVIDEATGESTVTVTEEELNIIYGCMHPTACNYISTANADCAQQNASITAGWTSPGNVNCCDMNLQTTCYLDLNNNGYYEEMDNTNVSTCDCGTLGTGWVSGDEVATDPEVKGCTSPTMDGEDIPLDGTVAGEIYICKEWNPLANVDDSSCCLDEPQGMADMSEGDVQFDEYSLIGGYNVTFAMGYPNSSETECAANAALTEEWYGDSGNDVIKVQIATLGPNGSFQYFESKTEIFEEVAQWEYPAELDTLNEYSCQMEADDQGADYWYCSNWGDAEYQNCENFTWDGDCITNGCHWETHFCNESGGGGAQPCHEIVIEDFSGDFNVFETKCLDNGCDYDYNSQLCITPSEIPGEQCWGFDEAQCNDDPDCMLGSQYMDCDDCNCGGAPLPCWETQGGGCCGGGSGGSGGSGDDDGPPDCIFDCSFPQPGDNTNIYGADGLNTDNGYEMCQWITTTLWIPNSGTGYQGETCVANDCSNYPSEGGGTMADDIAAMSNQCFACLFDTTGYACNEMWNEQGGSEQPAYCGDDNCDLDETNATCPSDCSGSDLDCQADPTPCPGWVAFNNSNINGTATANSMCVYINNLFYGMSYSTGQVTAGDTLAYNSCIGDCDWEDYNNLTMINEMCDMCLTYDWSSCGDIFPDDNGFNPQISLPGALASQINKANGMSQLNNSLSRGDHDISCGEGEIIDCSGDGDCCSESWLGDGYGDCQDQAWGCDLTCYNNDGGDCAGSEEGAGEGAGYENLTCMPTDPCWFINSDIDCGFSGCIWEFTGNASTDYCHPEPKFSDDCSWIDVPGYCNDEEDCKWIYEEDKPTDAPANWQPHCAVDYSWDDCWLFTAIGGTVYGPEACDNSSNCEWNPPQHLQEWASGACMTPNLCGEWQDENACNTKTDCQWNYEYWHCEETGANWAYCDCKISHTQKSCNDLDYDNDGQPDGTWELAPWCQGDNSNDCDEMVCMVGMAEWECYEFQYNDPCAASNSGENEQVYWNMTTEQCVIVHSYSEGGIWSLNSDGDFCIEWDQDRDPDCDNLNNPDECYCGNCWWEFDDTDPNGGECHSNDENQNGRAKIWEQAKRYEDVLYNLSTNNEGQCFEYSLDPANGSFEIVEYMDDGGNPVCQEIVFTKITPDS